jgi:signal transduction histidine kinase
MTPRIRSFWKEGLPILGIVLGFIGISILAFASYSRISEFQDHTDWVNHSHQVRFELEQTIFLISAAHAATRGYAIAGDEDFLAAYESARRELPEKISELALLVADNPAQAQNISMLKFDVDHFMALQEHTISLRHNSNTTAPALTYFAEGNGQVSTLDSMRGLVTQMQDLETELMTQREQRITLDTRHTKSLLIFGTAAVYLVFGLTFLILAREVRHRKEADKALIDANNRLQLHTDQLEQANKELEGFSYSISHDLRIPLRAVAGYATILSEDYEEKLDSNGKRLLGVIRENSKRMGVLIDDLLAFSKSGRQALSLVDIDMRALVENTLVEIPQREGSNSTQMIVEELPHAHGDRALLKQVWMNLLSNAVKYSSKTEAANIRVSGTRNEGEVVYAVSDNGVGFDMQYYNKLFGVFQRLHSIDEFPGTGVGLAIVQRIVLRHGGRVWADGTINQGATFYFALPNKE